MVLDRIIDSHSLVGVDFWLSNNKSELRHRNDLEEYQKALKSVANSYKSVIMPFPSSKNGSYMAENRYILELHQKYDWTIPVLAFNPCSKENIRFVSEKLENGEVKGLVLWPVLCKLDLDMLSKDDQFDYVLRKYKPWITVHVGAGNEKDIHRVTKLNNYSPVDSVKLAAEYPDVKFNLSHVLRISEHALSMAENMENVIIDISGICMHKRWYEYGTNVFPASDSVKLKELDSSEIIYELMHNEQLANKLVFGTQYPFDTWCGFDIKEEIELVKNARLEKTLFEQLMYKNFELFLRKEVFDEQR